MLESVEQPKCEKRGKPKNRGNGQGTVYKYTLGRFRWKFVKNGRTRASGIAKNRSEAEKELSKAIADYERNTLVSMNRVTLEEYSRKWLGRLKGKAQSTLDKYTRELNLILEHIGGIKLRELRAGDIKDALVAIADRIGTKGLGKGRLTSSSTLAGVRTRIRAVVREAVADGIIPNDVTISVKRVKKLKTEHPGIALDFDQAARFHELGEALHDAGACRLWGALFLCVSVGLRKGEVMGLQWQDVDFDSSTLKICRNYTTSSSKGAEMKDSTKTEASTREVMFPPSVKAALKRQREKMEVEARALGVKLKPSSPVFPNELGGLSHPDTLNRSLACVLKWSNPNMDSEKAGITRTYKLSLLELRLRSIPLEHRARLATVVRSGKALPIISPHDLRHTAGSLMLMKGTPLEAVSDMLGHKDSSITRQIYIHITDNFRRESVFDLFPALPSRAVQAVALN
jgi:integrase